jgi:hypothetical protein
MCRRVNPDTRGALAEALVSTSSPHGAEATPVHRSHISAHIRDAAVHGEYALICPLRMTILLSAHALRGVGGALAPTIGHTAPLARNHASSLTRPGALMVEMHRRARPVRP